MYLGHVTHGDDQVDHASPGWRRRGIRYNSPVVLMGVGCVGDVLERMRNRAVRKAPELRAITGLQWLHFLVYTYLADTTSVSFGQLLPRGVLLDRLENLCAHTPFCLELLLSYGVDTRMY